MRSDPDSWTGMKPHLSGIEGSQHCGENSTSSTPGGTYGTITLPPVLSCDPAPEPCGPISRSLHALSSLDRGLGGIGS